MSTNWIRIRQQIKHYLIMKWNLLTSFVQHYWFRSIAFAMLAFLLWHKDLSFHLDLSAAQTAQMGFVDSQPLVTQAILPLQWFQDTPSQETDDTPPIPSAQKVSTSLAQKNNLSNTYSNMLFPEEKNISSVASRTKPNAQGKAKRKKQKAYIQRFAKVAQSEMHKYGIPASIKLAQGLIESNAGESPLSRKNNNHFGMKCFSKKCRKGHCSNYTDDSHKDFFRIYSNAWESYRAHSQMLNGKRYRHLQKLGKDYKAWAHGLKKAGYATDKKYAEKLIFLIESMGLHKYD